MFICKYNGKLVSFEQAQEQVMPYSCKLQMQTVKLYAH